MKESNTRIAKNTLLLYIRTFFVMVVTLFTSRVILQTLGVDDYGIYNVVGGVVAMFSMLTGALSNAISRFITFELGKGNKDKLIVVFSTSVNILLVLSVLVAILGETVGYWFLNSEMNIPADRLYAANWVLQCSLITFIINLISVPYNAAIIAHEKMSAFAYVSILEVTLKLLIVYSLYVSPWDKLITYAILLVFVAIIIRFTYSIYCKKHFDETKYHIVHDNNVIKEIAGFAGWNFLSNGAYLLNTQGINIMINMFFGVGVNAARGIATQVESAIMKFVIDFTTAINPQITKNYAQGNLEAMNSLICKGAKFSFFLLFAMSLPIMIEAETILNLWLTVVPEHTVAFLRLVIIATMIDRLCFTCYTACMATGTIRKYVLVIASIGFLVFPLTYLAFKLGAPVETTYVIFALVYVFVDVARLRIMKGLFDFPIKMFVNEVVLKVIPTGAIAIFIPLIIVNVMEPTILRLVISIVVCLLSVSFSALYIGMKSTERTAFLRTISNYLSKLTKK